MHKYMSLNTATFPTWTFFSVQYQKAQSVQGGKNKVTFKPFFLFSSSFAYLNTKHSDMGCTSGFEQ